MIIYTEKGYGLHEHLAINGVHLIQRDNIWTANAPDETVNQLIQEYNPWPAEKSAKLAEIDADFNAAISNITAGWPEQEIKSWPKQEAEARAFIADSQALTPMLSGIALQRGITVADLAARVIRDADAFTQASGYFIGLRHKARQQVQVLPSDGQYERLSELASIRFGG
jgi:hypothetical protein